MVYDNIKVVKVYFSLGFYFNQTFTNKFGMKKQTSDPNHVFIKDNAF